MPSKQEIAEKIAELIADKPNNELAFIAAKLDSIASRLDRLEAAAGSGQAVAPHRPLHPSAEHFSVAEAIADEIFAGLHKEKACTFEPHGKPCDHCSMCSSRGF